MNKDLDSPTRLTEFAPLNPDVQRSGVAGLFSRFFRSSSNEPASQSTPPRDRDHLPHNISEETERVSPVTEIQSPVSEEIETPDISLAFDVSEGRSLPNVLKRISSLVALKHVGLHTYKDTNLKQYWMPDSKSKECFDCGERFTAFRRRHHCRICGQIFCSRCCSHEVPGKIIACTGDLRVCTYCCKVVLSYLQSVDITADLSADLRALQENLQTKFGNVDSPLSSHNSLSPHGPIVGTASGSDQQTGDLDPASCVVAHRKTSVGYQEERFVLARDNVPHNSVLEEENRWNTQESAALSALAEELGRPSGGVATQTLCYKLRNNQHNVFTGNQLVTWLLSRGKAATREQGVAIGCALVEAGFVECIGEQGFSDTISPYRLTVRESTESPLRPPEGDDSSIHDSESRDELSESRLSSQEGQEPTWVKDLPHRTLDSTTADSESEGLASESDLSQSLRSSRSLYRLDLNIERHVARLTRPANEDLSPSTSTTMGTNPPAEGWSPPSASTDVTTSCEFLGDNFLHTAQAAGSDEPVTWHEKANLRSDNGDCQAYNTLNVVYNQHERGLLRQLLNGKGLSQSWADVILPLIGYLAKSIDVSSSDSGNMDIREYVQVKRMPGGERSDCEIVNGIVCSKNIAHRSMKSYLDNPQILLLDCAVVYQRDEGRLLSLESVMMQEQECLRNAVARIAALRPDIVMVSRTVSRLAQELLLDLRVTLILNVKTSVLERIARCTCADILKSVDVQISRPRLGTCQKFYLRSFTTDAGVQKTLMFFEKCQRSDLGRSIILRGGSHSELTRLKYVLRFMIYVRYSWRLELSYLMDEFACPPNPPADAFEDASFARSHSLSDSRSPLKSKHSTSSIKSSVESESMWSKRSVSDVDQLVCSTPVISTPEDDIFAFDTQPFTSPKALEGGEKHGSNTEEQDSKSCPSESERECNRRRPTTESVSDFSDPLHQYLTQGEDAQNSSCSVQQQLAVAKVPFLNKFRKALDDTTLSSSPYIKFTVPYLETEQALNSELRKFFPEQIYWSAQFDGDTCTERSRGATMGSFSETGTGTHVARPQPKLRPRHPFVEAKLTKPASHPEIQTLLALFRANGGRFTPCSSLRYTNSTSPTIERFLSRKHHDVPDALDPAAHQHLTILFYKTSLNNQNQPAFCGDPRVMTLEFYGHHISLGAFLENYCFASKVDCGCKMKPLRHTRRYVHNGGCIEVKLNMLDPPLPDNNIWMWSICTHCKVTSPAVPMSPDTGSLSFAKYLELRFYGDMYTCRKTNHTDTETEGSPRTVCTHSLHHDYLQCFAQRNIVASFRYSSVTVCEVLLPPPIVRTVWDNQLAAFVSNDLKNMISSGQEIFGNVRKHLSLIPAESQSGAVLHQMYKKEQSIFKAKTDEVKSLLDAVAAAQEKDKWEVLWRSEDALVDVVHFVLESIPNWNTRFQEVLGGKPRSSGKTFNFLQESTEKASFIDSLTRPSIGSVESQGGNESVATASPKEDGALTMGVDTLLLPGADGSSDASASFSSEALGDEAKDEQSNENRNNNPVGISTGMVAIPLLNQSFDSPSFEAAEKEWLMDDPENIGGKHSRTGEGVPSESITTPVPETKVSSTPHQPLSDKKKGNVKELFSQLLPSTPPLVYIPVPTAVQDLHILGRNNTVIPLVVCDSQLSSIIAYALASADYRKALDDMRVHSQQNFNINGRPPGDKSRNDLLVASKPLANGESQASVQLIFRQDSTSTNYSAKGETGNIEGVQYSANSSVSCTVNGPGSANNPAGNPPQPTVTKDEKASNYIEVQFNDSTTKFYCRVYFADEFSNLRKLVWPSGEEGFMRSLAHCVPWDARGGKSGSTFCKTRDDRLVLKEMSPNELPMFLEHAPHYFSYVTKCHSQKRPTLLGKILGVYKVAHKPEGTGASFFLLVMENLFYSHSVSHKFDLKGSMRNRLANTCSESQSEIVLLDENLIKMTCNKPLYLQPHSEAVLKQAIQNDTQFLSSQSVMDYSLLVGLDEGGKVFVVGIIDYIRTFTLDKMLETVIKKVISSQGKTPTIVSPKEYRIRFINAMGRYFLPVPDRWYGLGRGFS